LDLDVFSDAVLSFFQVAVRLFPVFNLLQHLVIRATADSTRFRHT
jgi:hypothetical protein